jgi:hypothetical protein
VTASGGGDGDWTDGYTNAMYDRLRAYKCEFRTLKQMYNLLS